MDKRPLVARQLSLLASVARKARRFQVAANTLYEIKQMTARIDLFSGVLWPLAIFEEP